MSLDTPKASPGWGVQAVLMMFIPTVSQQRSWDPSDDISSPMCTFQPWFLIPPKLVVVLPQWYQCTARRCITADPLAPNTWPKSGWVRGSAACLPSWYNRVHMHWMMQPALHTAAHRLCMLVDSFPLWLKKESGVHTCTACTATDRVARCTHHTAGLYSIRVSCTQCPARRSCRLARHQ